LMSKVVPRARFSKGLAFGFSLVAALAMLVLAVSTPAAAETLDLTMYGNVTDSLHMPVEGASVVVENLDTGKSYNVEDPTDENGQYYFNLPAAEWTEGDHLRVTATFGSTMGVNTGVAPDPIIGQVQIDVQLSEAIPEFGTTLGAMIAACIAGAVAIVAIGTPRKQ
jgi:hypothetical protein